MHRWIASSLAAAVLFLAPGAPAYAQIARVSAGEARVPVVPRIMPAGASASVSMSLLASPVSAAPALNAPPAAVMAPVAASIEASPLPPEPKTGGEAAAPTAVGTLRAAARKAAEMSDAPRNDAADSVKAAQDFDGDKRIRGLIAAMTLDEKISLVGGVGDGNATKPIPRLGIPSLRMTDGSQGVWDASGRMATAFPAGVALGASWDPELVKRVAGAIAEEARERGKRALLGPEINMQRVPLGGRNMENYGEDPYLTSQLAFSFVSGVQEKGVIAVPKHFLLNDQEIERQKIDIRADERTLHEIYLPPFAAAIRAGALAVMAAYNKVNGVYSAENKNLLRDILRKMLGFKGLVMSDWGAVQSAVPSVEGGLDLEMPASFFFDKPLREAIASGVLPVSAIEEMIFRLLKVMRKIGVLDEPAAPEPAWPTKSPPAHVQLALEAAEQSMVLLKNDGQSLPLDVNKTKSLAVIGPGAAVYRHGHSSSEVYPFSFVTPLDALRRRFGAKTVRYAPGVSLPLYDPWKRQTPATVPNDDEGIRQAVEAATGADAAVVFVSLTHLDEAEGKDRDSLSLPGRQDDLIEAVAKANPNTTVVFIGGSPILMGRWVGRVKSVLAAWYPGQQEGDAIADVLVGDANPSGKLPVSFPKRWEDSSAHDSYPGEKDRIVYSEGVNVGYRHFDQKNIEPEFAFGHGLSYTRFGYSNINVRAISAETTAPRVEVGFDVTNTGAREGAEVAQLYVGQESPSVARPPKELKGFQKINLKPGESRRVTFSLDASAFAFWDSAKGAWTVEPGLFHLYVGSSSRDIRRAADVRIGAPAKD